MPGGSGSLPAVPAGRGTLSLNCLTPGAAQSSTAQHGQLCGSAGRQPAHRLPRLQPVLGFPRLFLAASRPQSSPGSRDGVALPLGDLTPQGKVGTQGTTCPCSVSFPWVVSSMYYFFKDVNGHPT